MNFFFLTFDCMKEGRKEGRRKERKEGREEGGN